MTMWVRRLCTGVCVIIVFWATPGHAQTKFEFGFRTGYGLPLGKAADGGEDLNTAIPGQVPLWFDVGARLERGLALGAYFHYGLGFLGQDLSDECEQEDQSIQELGGDVGCRTYNLRLGVELAYHFETGPETPHPYVGLGLGYEWLGFSETLSAQGLRATVSSTAGGPEFVNFQAGLDIPVGLDLAVGPFAAFTLAQYDSVRAGCSGDCGDLTSASMDIDDKALHHWLFIGVRGTFLM